MNKTYLNILKSIAFLIFLFCAMDITTIAQNDPLAINEVKVETIGTDPSDPTVLEDRILVKFNRPISTVKAKPTDTDTELTFLEKPEIYTILKQNPTSRVITTIEVTKVKAHCCQKEFIYLFPNVTELVGKGEENFQFIFIINDNTKVIFKKPITITISLPKRNTSGDATTDAEQTPISSPATFDIRPSKSKDDSNVYLAGELTGATDSKPNFSVDIKINTPFVAKKPEARFFFNLKANSNSDADPDSLNLGFEYTRNRRAPNWLKKLFGSGQPSQTIQGLQNCIGSSKCVNPRSQSNELLQNYNYSFYTKIESDREFDNTNFLVGGNLTLPLAKFTRSSRTEFNFFVGSDFGKNLKSPVKAAEGRAIVRPYAGVSTFLGFLHKNDFFPISFEGNYTNRWLLTRELKLKKDDAGNLVAVFFDKEPRFYVETKFNYQFNPYFGIFAGYEYGEKPPDYKLVNNSFKFGLVYKFKFKGAGDK